MYCPSSQKDMEAYREKECFGRYGCEWAILNLMGVLDFQSGLRHFDPFNHWYWIVRQSLNSWEYVTWWFL